MNMNGMDMTTSTSSMDMNGVDMTTSTSLMDTTMTSSQLDSLLTSAMEAMTGMTSMSEMTSSESMKMNMDTSSKETTMTGMEHMSSMSSTMAATMTAMTGMTTMSGMSKMSGMATMSGMSEMSGMAHTTGMSGMSSMVMSTSASSGHKKVSCTMSMLWNWYSKDVCFISRQWRTSSAGLFAGTCIGVFALLLAINWWRRILNQYKIYCAELRADEVENVLQHGGTLATREVPFTFTKMENRNMFVEMMIPFAETWKHQWLWALNKNLAVQCGDQVYIYPSVFEHLIYCVGDTMEWSVHHVIMLLFMYFNGYVFISCMIGAGVGFLLFQYKNINFSKRGDNVSKRCCL